MKRMRCKKILMTLSALALLGIVLSGCQTSPKIKLSSSDPVSLKLWHYYNGPQQEAFKKLVIEFNETIGREKGITVELFSQGSINELTEAVLSAVNKKVGAEEVPDIFAGYADTAYQVDKLGMVASLDALFNR